MLSEVASGKACRVAVPQESLGARTWRMKEGREQAIWRSHEDDAWGACTPYQHLCSLILFLSSSLLMHMAGVSRCLLRDLSPCYSH